MEKIIHLYIISKCGKNCLLCCNKFYDMNSVHIVTEDELKSADIVCLTGGDPFLYSELHTFIGELCKKYPNIKNIYIYTSGSALIHYLNFNWDKFIKLTDKVSVSIAPKDILDWVAVTNILRDKVFNNILSSMKSNRLMIFEDQERYFEQFLKDVDLSMFTILGRKWDSEFNVPENEIFRKLPKLFD